MYFYTLYKIGLLKGQPFNRLKLTLICIITILVLYVERTSYQTVALYFQWFNNSIISQPRIASGSNMVPTGIRKQNFLFSLTLLAKETQFLEITATNLTIART